MSQGACPSLERLSAFALGLLPEPGLSEVATHLDVCADCEEQAGRLDGTADAFLSEMRRLPASLPDPESPSSEETGRYGAGPLPVVGGQSWGEFRIVREIGRGGMGVVCEAYQGSLNRHVALKFLPEHGNVSRFRREAQAAGRLHHTNIVPVFGVGEHQGRHFYVMQYIAGRGLDAVLKAPAAATAAVGTGRPPAGFSAREAARIARRQPGRWPMPMARG